MKDKFQVSFDEKLVQKLCKLCDTIESKLIKNEDAQKLIDEFNSQVNHIPHETSFYQYYSWTSQEDFIKSLLLPVVVEDKSITKEELIELIQKIINLEKFVEYELDYWLDILKVNLYESISDLIYHNNVELTAEEIYEQGLEKRKEEVNSIIYL